MSIADNHYTAAGYESWQLIVGYFIGFEFTQHAVAMASQVGNFSIGLVVPKGKTRVLGEIFGLVDKATADTTGVHLLQGHDIKSANRARNFVHVFVKLSMWQDMFPGFGNVMAIGN